MANLTDKIVPTGLLTQANLDAALVDYATTAQGILADAAAPLVSPALSGTPTAPTATVGTNTTQVATTAFVAALVVDPTLNSFQRATAISDTFTVQYAKTTTDAGVVSVYKEVASADETDNVFSATAAGTAFEFDATKLAFTGGSLGLKVLSTTKYVIGGGSYDSVSFSIASQDADPQEIAFNTDGTKMFVLGKQNDSIFQYTLSTGFDLSTVSYDSVSFSIAGQDTTPRSIAFNTNGTKMYMVGSASDTVHQYTLSTGFNLSTASYNSVSFSIAGQDTQPRSIAFNTDGTKMFILGDTNRSVFQYTLSTGFDLSTASYDSVSFSVSGQDTDPHGIAFNTNGTKMFMVGSTSDTVHQYTLSTGFNLSTASYDSVSFSIAGQDTDPTGIAFNTDGTKMFMVGESSDTVHQYTLPLVNTFTANEYLPAITKNPLDTEFWTTLTSITASDTANGQSAFYCFSTDSRASWLIISTGSSERTIARLNSGTWQYNSNVTYGSETFVSASVNTESSALSSAMSVAVNRMDGGFGGSGFAGTSYDSVSFSVNSQEGSPQGVFFKPDGTKMYVVGIGSGGDVFQYSLSTAWVVSTASYDSVNFSVNSQDTLPMSVFFKPDGTKMYVTGFTNDTVFQYSLSTAWDLSTTSYDSVSFSVNSQEAGPTGMFFKPDGDKMYILGTANDTVFQYTTAVPPAFTSLADSLDEAVILHTTASTVSPSYTNTAINYAANARYTLLAPVTDYDVKLGTNQATITSKVAGNIKGRIV
jgi:DNA-binding beta-propeller fold protein YncE